MEVLEKEEALRLIEELLAALYDNYDQKLVDLYGTYVSCLVTMQKVFQRYDWGYAEWPDVIEAVHIHKGDQDFEVAWSELQSRLLELGFPDIPVFDGNMSKEQLLGIMEDMLSATDKVAQDVQRLHEQGDPVIDALNNFLETRTQEAYESWKALCGSENLKDIEESAKVEGEYDQVKFVSVPSRLLKEWRDAHLLKTMLNMMAPLTELQEKNIRLYGIGATHMMNLMNTYEDDPAIADAKAKIEEMMKLIHPAGSDVNTTDDSETSGTD